MVTLRGILVCRCEEACQTVMFVVKAGALVILIPLGVLSLLFAVPALGIAYAVATPERKAKCRRILSGIWS